MVERLDRLIMLAMLIMSSSLGGDGVANTLNSFQGPTVVTASAHKLLQSFLHEILLPGYN